MNSKMKLITIDRSACNGPCPIYKASIAGSGEVSYEGKHFVHREGKHHWKISTTRVEQLARYFEEARYLFLMSEYQQVEVTCGPGCITSIEYEDGRKKQLIATRETLVRPRNSVNWRTKSINLLALTAIQEPLGF